MPSMDFLHHLSVVQISQTYSGFMGSCSRWRTFTVLDMVKMMFFLRLEVISRLTWLLIMIQTFDVWNIEIFNTWLTNQLLIQ